MTGCLALTPGGLLAEEEPDFTISSRDNEVAGELSAGSEVLLEFSSRQQSTGAIEIEIASSGGALFQGSYDSEAGVLTIRGFGAKVQPDDKPLIQRAHDELVREEGEADPSDRMKFLLERMLLLLSDAPASFVWDEMEIEIGVERQGVDEDPSERALAELLGHEPEPFCLDKDDDDDTTIGCTVKMRATQHDACPAHGLNTYNVNTGCGSVANCVGRCGAGCGFNNGKGHYAQDCADHDKCCDDHGGCQNPFDAECGDEFGEAADDFFRAHNCQNCANPPGGGGGGGLPPPGGCGPARQADSATWVVANGDSVSRSGMQVDWNRPGRLEKRGKRSFVYGQWALHTLDGVADGSNAEFSIAAEEAASGTWSVGDDAALLVVQTPIHPVNERWIPRPRIHRWLGALPATASMRATTIPEGDVWFRVEVSKEGVVDSVAVLDDDNARVGVDIVRSVVEEHAPASLVFDDDRRHRVVVFGRLNFSKSAMSGTDYRLAEVFAYLPLCCCGTDEPFCL